MSIDSLDTYVHNPTAVQAIQVAKPWTRLQQALPSAHLIKKQSGALAWVVMTNLGDGSAVRAYPGDWIIRENDRWLTLTDEEFQRQYALPGEGTTPPSMSLAELTDLDIKLGVPGAAGN